MPWSDKFLGYDVFFDNFSNLLVLHDKGAFIVYEMLNLLDKPGKDSRVPHTMNLEVEE